MISKDWRKGAFIYIIIGALQYIIFSGVAMLFYAGGTIVNPSTTGYSFWSNYRYNRAQISKI